MADLIERQAAIEAMCWVCGHDCDKSEFVYNAPQDEQVIMCPEHYALSTLPSAQPEQHWIPCSERLPIARQSVILSTKEWTGEGCYWETTEHHVIWKGYRWNATYWDDEVIAWMPLPEPWKGEEHEDK